MSWPGPSTCADSAALDNSELVFVGYGVVAPEYNWDDYKGLDVKGKTLVMLVNDPPVPDPANAAELDPKIFGGKAMTYYGRWTYKYEIGAEKGAAGVLLIHETEPAGYPFDVVQSKVSEQFDLVTPDKNMGRVADRGLDHARSGPQPAEDGRPGFRRAEDSRRRPASSSRCRSASTASMTIKNTLRTIDSKNVVARLEGARSGPEGRVRRLHRALGSSGHRPAGQRRHDLQRREGQRRRAPAGCSRSRGRSRSCRRRRSGRFCFSR